MHDTAHPNTRPVPTWWDALNWRDRVTGDRLYIGRRRAWVAGNPGTAGKFTLSSRIARVRVAEQRATLAVQVLAATDTLPASRRLYAELLRAGVLASSLRSVA